MADVCLTFLIAKYFNGDILLAKEIQRFSPGEIKIHAKINPLKVRNRKIKLFIVN